MNAVLGESGKLVVLTGGVAQMSEDTDLMPSRNIAIEFHPAWLFDLQHQTLDDLINNKGGLGVFVNILLDRAFEGCNIWLVDVEQRLSPGASPELGAFEVEASRYVIPSGYKDLEEKDPGSLFSGSAFDFI